MQEMYLKRKSFAFNSDRPGVGGEEARTVFEKSMSTVDMTFQNLDSSEISLTDVSHYFDSDPTNLVQGLRKDGRKPNSYVADTTTANAQVRPSPSHLDPAYLQTSYSIRLRCSEGEARGDAF